MIQISEADIERARDLIAHGTPEAVGYKLLIKPIDAVTSMTMAESQQFETLAKAGFQDKTDEQADRESMGTNHGILCHVGPGAFKGDVEKLCTTWPKEGDVIIFNKYTGLELELPPGSGDKYRFANDEALLGRMVKRNG